MTRWCPSCDRWHPVLEMVEWPLARRPLTGFRANLVLGYGGLVCRSCAAAVLALVDGLEAA